MNYLLIVLFNVMITLLCLDANAQTVIEKVNELKTINYQRYMLRCDYHGPRYFQHRQWLLNNISPEELDCLWGWHSKRKNRQQAIQRLRSLDCSQYPAASLRQDLCIYFKGSL